MKKLITCILAGVFSAGLFLLLPQLLAAQPELGTQPLGWAYFVFPIAALFYGGLIPFLCFGDRYLAIIEGAIFMVFAWAAGWLMPAVSLGGTIFYAVLMLGSALTMSMLRRALPLRFRHGHWLRKLLWAVLALAGLTIVFLCRELLRPEQFQSSIAYDTYDFPYILLYFPLLSLICGGLLPVFGVGDTGFMALALSGFTALLFLGFVLTGIVVPWFSLILGFLALVAACAVGWLRGCLLLPNQTKTDAL